MRCSGAARDTNPAGVSSATTRPASMTAMRSQSRSASSMKCVTSTTVTPLFAHLLDQVPGLPARVGIESRGQLIEDRHLWAADQR